MSVLEQSQGTTQSSAVMKCINGERHSWMGHVWIRACPNVVQQHLYSTRHGRCNKTEIVDIALFR